jgi:hypothetical protein
MLDRSPVKSADDVLGAGGLQMFPTPAEVDHFFRMARREIRRAANVPSVG